MLPIRLSPRCTKGESALATTHRVPGAVLTERAHSVPLDHSQPDGEKITVFTRELAAPDGLDRPYMLFLQGGPGFEATRPTAPPAGWQKRAIADYRVLLIDQRGTGRSAPVGDIPGSTPQEQATYMTHLGADGIVRDAELIRQELGTEGMPFRMKGSSFDVVATPVSNHGVTLFFTAERRGLKVFLYKHAAPRK